MCDDLALLAAIAAAARRASCRRSVVGMTVLLLSRCAEGIGAAGLAELAGESAAVITRVIAALGEEGVIDAAGALAERWRRAPPPPRSAHAEAQARYRARLKAEAAGCADHPAITRDHPVITRDHARDHAPSRRDEANNVRHLADAGEAARRPVFLEEKEKKERALSEGSISALARPRAPAAFTAKLRWATNTLRLAQEAGKVAPGEAARMWQDLQAMTPDRSLPNWGLTRRTNADLDRFERILKGETVPPPARQGSLLLPLGKPAGSPDGERETIALDDAYRIVRDLGAEQATDAVCAVH